MTFDNNMTKRIALRTVLLVILSGSVWAQGKVHDISFGLSSDSLRDAAQTLQSLVKIQGTGGLCQDALYLITQYGDRQDLFEAENQKCMDRPMINETWRFCSVFSSKAGKAVVMGRNWDNQNVGSIIISLNRPPQGYVSISFARAMDLGFPMNMDLEQIKDSPFGNRLLLSSFYATDGMNEHGLAVSTAGVRQVTVGPSGEKQFVFITSLVRKILDGAQNVDEAVDLVAAFIPFDLDMNSLNTHLYVADSSGKSVILEYVEDQWRATFSDKPWQVLTNKPIYNVPDADLRGRCWRYQSISETLDSTEGKVDWQGGMKILQDVAQKGTTWSVVYCPQTKEIYFSVYQDWATIYRLKAF